MQMPHPQICAPPKNRPSGFWTTIRPHPKSIFPKQILPHLIPGGGPNYDSGDRKKEKKDARKSKSKY